MRIKLLRIFDKTLFLMNFPFQLSESSEEYHDIEQAYAPPTKKQKIRSHANVSTSYIFDFHIS